MTNHMIIGLSLFNYQDDARSNKHKINSKMYLSIISVSLYRQRKV